MVLDSISKLRLWLLQERSRIVNELTDVEEGRSYGLLMSRLELIEFLIKEVKE